MALLDYVVSRETQLANLDVRKKEAEANATKAVATVEEAKAKVEEKKTEAKIVEKEQETEQLRSKVQLEAQKTKNPFDDFFASLTAFPLVRDVKDLVARNKTAVIVGSVILGGVLITAMLVRLKK